VKGIKADRRKKQEAEEVKQVDTKPSCRGSYKN
jgi:hypothetical protein